LDSTDRVRGFLNAMPLDEDAFAGVLAGTLKDNEITQDSIAPYTPGASVSLYLMAVAVDPEARSVDQGLLNEPLERMTCGFIRRLEELARERDVTVKEVAAVGWTAEGRRLCELLGMQRQRKDSYGNDVFYIDLTKELNGRRGLCDGFARLRELYRQLDLTPR